MLPFGAHLWRVGAVISLPIEGCAPCWACRTRWLPALCCVPACFGSRALRGALLAQLWSPSVLAIGGPPCHLALLLRGLGPLLSRVSFWCFAWLLVVVCGCGTPWINFVGSGGLLCTSDA